jgi:sugar O-acyltransferase (sialic acid O-acetyltransferase NeuD family)
MRKLVIYGAGLIGEVAAFFFRKDSDYEVAAFANASQFMTSDRFDGLPLVAFETIQESHPPSDYDLFIALGYAKTNQIRQARFLEAKAMGYACATYISSRATYFDNAVGENCFILENNVIQPFVTIGNNVTLWSGNHIGHHSKIRDHCFISSHVVVSGGCDIGENCFLGVNSTIRDNVSLGRFVVMSPGAIAMKDCEERTVVQPPESTYRVIRKDVI